MRATWLRTAVEGAPLTHAAGRVFDAMSVLLGAAPDLVTYEGQSAIRLEPLAPYPMHELSRADALVKQVEDLVAREGAQRAVSITVEMGAFSGVDPDALSAAFPFVAEASATVARAVLIVKALPGDVTCEDCGKRQEDLSAVACTSCGSNRLRCAGGRDLTLRSVEMEFE
jgi:hydrogenase nickel incorporation protein HypA/HybF